MANNLDHNGLVSSQLRLDLPSSQRTTVERSSRKRKHDRIKVETEGQLLLTAQILPLATPPEQVTFRRVADLQRSALPLSWLELVHTDDGLPTGSLVSVLIDRLDNAALSLIVVRLCPNGGLYVLEEVADQAYLICGLRASITEFDITAAASGITIQISPHNLVNTNASPIGAVDWNAEHIENTLPPTRSSPKKPRNRRGAAARKAILPEHNLPVELRGPVVSKQSSVTDHDLPAQGNPLDPTVSTPLTPGAIIADQDSSIGPAPSLYCNDTKTYSATDEDSIRQSIVALSASELSSKETSRSHYHETLYLSKTSLAFYAKGPLRRARGSLQTTSNPSDAITLLEIYKESLLPSKKMDIKFRETVPAIIAGVVQVSRKDRDAMLAESSKKSKRKKLGRDGLWPNEENLVRMWWLSRDQVSACVNAEAREQESTKAVMDLRLKETKMQILIILEILVIEAYISRVARKNTSCTTPEIKIESNEMSEPVLADIPEATKKRDFTSELDMLVDKLCIWQTVNVEDVSKSPQEQQDDATSGQSKDYLRDFCVDVVVPFYSNKLPVICKQMCKKLGGSENVNEQSKTTLMKISATQKIKPGMRIPSRASSGKGRSLQRVLSEDAEVRGSKTAHSRASSVSIIASLKREDSGSEQRPASRGGMHKSASFSNREVDLIADAKAVEAKKQKISQVASQKKELDAAINALKKPNRNLAGKEVMDDIERRKSDNSLNTRVPSLSSHITATPKKPRTTHAPESAQRSISVLQLAEDNTHIPSSTTKPRRLASVPHLPRVSTTKKAVLSAINDTPAKPVVFSQISQPRSGIAAAGNARAETFIQSTPAKSRLRPDLNICGNSTPMRMIRSGKPIFLTPIRKEDVSVESAFRDAPLISEYAEKAMDRVMGSKEMNIYESLGWLDEDI